MPRPKRSYASRLKNLNNNQNVKEHENISKKSENMYVENLISESKNKQMDDKKKCSERTVKQVRKCNINRNIGKETNEVDRKCISGSFHQGNLERYSTHAGKQCVANALLAIVFSQIVKVIHWSSSTLDKILDLGNDYYSYLQSLPHIKNDYILINELLRTIEIEGKCFQLDISNEPQVGLIDSVSNFGLSLYEGLDSCLAIYEACFVTFANNTFAVIKHDHGYYVFDSHSRDEHGMVSANGTSVLLEFKDVMQLYSHILNLSVSMHCNPSEQFDITGIKVVMINAEINEFVNVCESVDDVIEDVEIESDNCNDVVISHDEQNELLFNPIRLEKRKQICQLVGLQVKDYDTEDVTEICTLKKPSKCKTIEGDVDIPELFAVETIDRPEVTC